jgi:hypothetical protein
LKDLPSPQGSIREADAAYAAKASAKYFDEEPLSKMLTEKNLAKERDDDYNLAGSRQDEERPADHLTNLKRRSSDSSSGTASPNQQIINR